MISSLVYSNNGKFNFPLLHNIPQFPRRKYFDHFTNDFNNIEELKKHWISAQDLINLNSKINFFKTHHLNCDIGNYSFTNNENTAATIYIVRDPRALVNSISNHYSKTLEDSKKFILTSRILNSNPKNLNDENIATLLGTWSEHYKFWVHNKQYSKNLLILKYEDLVKNTETELDKIIEFLRKYIPIEINDDKKKNIIETTNFNNLKKLENDGNFQEAVYNKITKEKINFFYKGPNNDWSNSISREIQKDLEIALKAEMTELSYI
tara:strand:- start:168 stop:962 length:795 start_codon:yes stop_codon:yes gene_type:complete